MEPVPKLDLKQIAEDAKADLLASRKSKIQNALKQFYEREASLTISVGKQRHDLAKNEKELESVKSTIQKIEAGDWSPVKEPEDKPTTTEKA